MGVGFIAISRAEKLASRNILESEMYSFTAPPSLLT